MTRYICPTDTENSDIKGCGFEFDAEPDHEGLVDCPRCGIWFNPVSEKGGALAPVQGDAP